MRQRALVGRSRVFRRGAFGCPGGCCLRVTCRMRLYLCWLCVVGLGCAAQAQRSAWRVQPGSSVSIYGTTNVNRFTCAAQACVLPDTLTSVDKADGCRTFINGRIRLPARCFDCGNGLMTSDFRKTLKAEYYTDVEIRLVELQGVGSSELTAELEIRLAGAARSVRVTCLLAPQDTRTWQLSGRHTFTFSQFGLTPPSRLLGTVRVDQALDVGFELVLRQL